MSFHVFVLWLHLLAVVVWIGGVGFLTLILGTVSASVRSEEFRHWIGRIGRHICVIGWEALGLIVLTGLFNLVNRARAETGFSPEFTEALLIKLALMAGMAAVQGWQHIGLLPQLAGSGGEEFARWRRKMLMGSAAFLVLGAGALWIGIWLRYV